MVIKEPFIIIIIIIFFLRERKIYLKYKTSFVRNRVINVGFFFFYTIPILLYGSIAEFVFLIAICFFFHPIVSKIYCNYVFLKSRARGQYFILLKFPIPSFICSTNITFPPLVLLDMKKGPGAFTVWQVVYINVRNSFETSVTLLSCVLVQKAFRRLKGVHDTFSL